MWVEYVTEGEDCSSIASFWTRNRAGWALTYWPPSRCYGDSALGRRSFLGHACHRRPPRRTVSRSATSACAVSHPKSVPEEDIRDSNRSSGRRFVWDGMLHEHRHGRGRGRGHRRGRCGPSGSRSWRSHRGCDRRDPGSAGKTRRHSLTLGGSFGGAARCVEQRQLRRFRSAFVALAGFDCLLRLARAVLLAPPLDTSLSSIRPLRVGSDMTAAAFVWRDQLTLSARFLLRALARQSIARGRQAVTLALRANDRRLDGP